MLPRTPVGPAVLLGLSLALSGCSGTPVSPASSPTPAPSGPTAASGGPASIPSDGVTLATLGFTHGPLQTFSVPRPAYVTATSDQASLVTVVIAAPSPSAVYLYLTSALPTAGFTISARRANGATPGADSTTATPAMSFTGHGWTGNFTGAGSTSAVTLRPAG